MSRRAELISHRRAKAKETLQDAQILFEAKRFASAVNRLYYALFYEVTALLLTRDLSSAKHGGVMSFFNEHFVKKGIVGIDSGRYYSRMFEFRQKSDYSDFVTFEGPKLREWIVRAGQFIAEIEAVIERELRTMKE